MPSHYVVANPFGLTVNLTGGESLEFRVVTSDPSPIFSFACRGNLICDARSARRRRQHGKHVYRWHYPASQTGPAHVSDAVFRLSVQEKQEYQYSVRVVRNAEADIVLDANFRGPEPMHQETLYIAVR